MSCQRIQISVLPHCRDPRAEAVAKQFGTLLNCPLAAVRSRDVYTLEGRIDGDAAARVAGEIANPVIQLGQLGEETPGDCQWLIIVGFLPGVTDNVARTLRDAVRDILGRELDEDEQVYSSVEYLLPAGPYGRDELADAALATLANPLIQSVSVLAREQWLEHGIPPNCPATEGVGEIRIDAVPLADDNAALVALSDERTLSLSLDEMRAVRDYFLAHGQDADRVALGLGADPSDAELEALAQTWSEHCKHKIFSADIEYTDENGQVEAISNCYSSYIKKSTAEIGEEVDWLLSVFSDNAGVIAFNDDYDLVYKVETHNSPSALDPYGGAMTGIVGVNRDPLGTGIGADLLINVWGYCLGSPFTPAADLPEGLLHPRRIRDGVHLGVIQGGNQSGIPYALGWEYFDPRYLGKPLVFCGTVGLLPKRVCGKLGYEKEILPGDLIVMAGGRIGKDGIHGATFSSVELNAESPAQAVQIGDPITQKRLSDFMLEARDLGLYRFITDNGAGGLSCSIGEMATECGGCRFDVAKAPLKYAGLQPWEVLLSEAQERMSYAVPPEKIDAFLELAGRRDVEATVLGEFTDSGKFHVLYEDRTIAFVDLDFLHKGAPGMQLKARWTPPQHAEPELPRDPDLGAILQDMIGRLNICSGETKARQYDHEVKGLSVLKPYAGVENDIATGASVLMAAPMSREGIVLGSAVLPRYADIDAYHMAASVIDLAVRRTVAVGGKLGQIAGLDNFCWPDPVESDKTPDGQYKLAQLVRANKALYEYTRAFSVPCISGKDSMKNDSTKGGRKISIPPTLLFSTIGKIDDVSKVVSLGVKRAGDLVYVLGETRRELGGSELYAALDATGSRVPAVDAAAAKKLYQALAAAIDAELCHSVHTPALGGLGVGLAKVALAGRLGIEVDLASVPIDEAMSPLEILFSESNSRFIVTIAADSQARFEEYFAGVACACIGKTEHEPVLTFYLDGDLETEVPLADLLTAYQDTLANA